ncbi:MAG TPA: hypothetical protein PKA33_15915 [Amaricoccus sp.]|uniref:hypothetical protein n=1 Tax=Amaricoccus sp. TaxID=1872485 RepID=UPI002C59719B|nr:hypothetical protein [Amaricoccus sp.]HMQ92510.1 hypothetical protein [Amaricoccus sp.]HMR53841.1 hypothetical protein [Amaricoccus sp.]HMR58958.1 hypothetical protein [Amaricoccus sp.]HMU00836.1 hypothetical protein [Amaricoccus sp.]
MITPDRIKAFLDDLALVSAKHGLEVYPAPTGEIAVAEIATRSGWEGYYACDTKCTGERWTIGPYDHHAKCNGCIADQFSLNVSTITGHQRIALARSLTAIKEQATYKSDVLRVMHQNAAALHRRGRITDAEMREFDELCLISPSSRS